MITTEPEWRRNDSPDLHTTFDHKTFEPLDASVDQRDQVILIADTISQINRSRKLQSVIIKMGALDCPG